MVVLAGPQCGFGMAAEGPLAPSQEPTAQVSAPEVSPERTPPGSSGIIPSEALDLRVLEGQINLPNNAVSADELSPMGMYRNADIVVKSVMIGLVIASIVTWTIAFAKFFELASAIRTARRGRRRLAESTTLERSLASFENGARSDPIGSLVRVAVDEIRLSPQPSDGDAAGLKERIRSHLERREMAASRKVSRGTGVLATIGSTAPFVGLFGTVWGIMNSFIGISKTQTTNLAVVAPGIAEALQATALGLVAAIPAVVIYNVLARRTATYRALLGDASAEILRQVSRDAERTISGPGATAE
jgi:biopolymer transport protein ExbB